MQLQNILHETSADRVLILKASNGGSIPRLGAHIYLSALMEVSSKPIRAILNDFQNIRADSAYIDLLQTLLKDGSTILKTTEMKTGQLRNIYESDDIKCARVILLHETPDSVYYLSASTTDGAIDGAHTEVVLDLAVSKIRSILKTTVK